MIEKVNMYHPDKIADRIAGAIVDYAYTKDDNPCIAVEVMLGHGKVVVIAETSVTLPKDTITNITHRITGDSSLNVDLLQVPQDSILAKNQAKEIRCGDNGVFISKHTPQYEQATNLAVDICNRFPSDGKYIFDFDASIATICQSNANECDILNHLNSEFSEYIINPLGYWNGGINTDTGCTNRKLGSDQALCNPNGLHGKDLSKADVSVSIYLNKVSRNNGGAIVTTKCSIGDLYLNVSIDTDTICVPYSNMVESSRNYIKTLGGFERFAEYGMRW